MWSTRADKTRQNPRGGLVRFVGRAQSSQNQSIAVVVGRTGDGSGDGTGTEGSTVRVGTQRYGRATERAHNSWPWTTAVPQRGQWLQPTSSEVLQ